MINVNGEYERPQDWVCQHNWMMIGCPIRTWTSGETNSEPPEGAPAMQKQRCLNCGGFKWVSVQT